MNTFQYKNYRIHYVVAGQGIPLLNLNGIMMSSDSWINHQKQWSRHFQYIGVDFIDQGKSSVATENYDYELQVDLLAALLKHLNIAEVFLTGVSFGAQIGLAFMLKYPSFVKKSILFNVSCYTSPWMQEVYNAWHLASYDAQAYYSVTIPQIYSNRFYNEQHDFFQQRKPLLLNVFADQSFLNRMNRLAHSLTDFDLRDQLANNDIETLIVGGRYDTLIPLNEQELIVKLMPKSQLQIFECGHATMTELETDYIRQVIKFLK